MSIQTGRCEICGYSTLSHFTPEGGTRTCPEVQKGAVNKPETLLERVTTDAGRIEVLRTSLRHSHFKTHEFDPSCPDCRVMYWAACYA